jgi:hypothetical protein
VKLPIVGKVPLPNTYLSYAKGDRVQLQEQQNLTDADLNAVKEALKNAVTDLNSKYETELKALPPRQ